MKKANLFLLFLFCLPLLTLADGIKILHGPYLQNLSNTEVTIVWEVTNESVGWVEIAPDDGSNYYSVERPQFFDAINGVKNASKLHAVKLTNLKPNTVYRYRIYAQEILSHVGTRVHYGDIVANSVRESLSFKTNDFTKSETSFVILNDVHVRKNVITPLLNYANYKDKDMVIFNGDMVSQFKSSEHIFEGFMDEAIDLFAKTKPFYYLRGNHETRGEFATHFQDYFCPREPHLYFTVHQGPVFFIFLDTGEDKPDSDIEYSGITSYDQYRSQQAEWLKEVVATEAFKKAKFKVVIAHMPPIPIKNAWHGQKEVLDKFVPILNKADVDIMLCGHLHRYLYEQPGAAFNFPILVNSNNSCIAAQTNGDKLNVKIYGLDGKISFDKEYTAKSAR